jgi:cytoskeleton protein RodZ
MERTEAEMGAFGERLRREREMRDISLDDIAATTKIGTRLLRALEDEEFDLLPGGIFNKGYVRAYAKHVGIDEEQAVADYLQAAHEAAPASHVTADQDASNRFERSGYEEASAGRRSTLPVVPLLIALVLIAGIAGGWRVYRDRQLERQQRDASAVTHDTAPQDSAPSAPATSPSTPERSSLTQASENRNDQPPTTLPGQNTTSPQGPTTPASLAPGAENAASSGGANAFELTIRPKDSAWVSIKSDGKFVVRGIIRPPDVKTIRASNQVVFWTGNAGAVEVSFNGKSVPVTGGENEERVLVFNSHGLLPSSAPQ